MNTLKLLTGWTVLCALVLSLAPVQAAPAKKDANILLIIADDLNDWISPMGGHSQAKTPSLERLAAQGVTFMNALCPTPLCNPSRTAMMSGKRPYTTGIYDNQQQWMPHIEAGICLNDYLRRHGFRSYGAGKIYHYRNFKPAEWDEVDYAHDDTLPNSVAQRTPPPFAYRMFTAGAPEGPFQEKRDEALLVDAQSVTWCINKLTSVTNRFFMTCGLHRPHTPWDVPKKYFDLYPLETLKLPTVLSNDLADVPPAGVAFANPAGPHARVVEAGVWKDRVRAYLAAISFMDAQVGRLLDALEKAKHGDNTIIVFVGDNGWHLGEKEHWAKVTGWAEATRVPMIWAAPGVAKAGARCDAPVDLMSVYTTLCKLTGVPVPSHSEGADISPLLNEPSAKWQTPAISTVSRDNNVVALDQWRYIRYADGSEELYDVKADPNEWTNLAGKPDLKDTKAKLAKALPKKSAEPVPRQDNQKKKKKKKAAA